MATKSFTGSSSSSSSSRSSWTHDVFLSFRGEDTRRNFADHLYTALDQAGIRTFRDKDISSELLKAIRESQIAVIVFSKRYASSRWCLDEHVEILECKNKIDQIVLSIFYDVDPSDVRKQMGSFAEAFEIHEEMYKDDIGRVKKWREALSEVANLSGWNLQDMADGYEAKFIQMIVEDVLRKLDCKHLDVATV